MEPELPLATIMEAIDGDPAAFRRLHRRYGSRVRHAVVSRVRHCPALRECVDDLVNDVWAYLLTEDRRVLRNWNPTLSPFDHYITLVSARKAGHLVKRRHVDRTEVAMSDMRSFEDQRNLESSIVCRDFVVQLWATAMPVLGEVDRELLVRTVLGGERAVDIAAVLGLSVANAHQRTRRMRGKLVVLARQLLATRCAAGGVTERTWRHGTG